MQLPSAQDMMMNVINHLPALKRARGGPREFQRNQVFVVRRIAVDVKARVHGDRDFGLHRGIARPGDGLRLADFEVAPTFREERTQANAGCQYRPIREAVERHRQIPSCW